MYFELTQSNQEQMALDLGASFAGGDDLIEKLLNDLVKVDRVLCTKEMFPKMIKIAKFLGPRGLMPSPAKGTVSENIKEMMDKLNESQIVESDEHGVFNIPIANLDWQEQEIESRLY